MSEILRTNNLTVGYGDVQILRDLNIEVQIGEVVTLLGPNGVGKSTTLETITGITPPIQGQVFFKKQEITGTSPEQLVRDGLSFVPEDRELFGRMSVEENLEMGAITRDRGQELSLKEVYDLFPRLKERRTQQALTLSGGEQQMLAIARGLMSDPDMLLLDEPSLGLAPQIIETVEKIILSVVNEGTSILLVEQNAEMAINVSDRGYILQDGTVQTEGTIDLIRESEYVQNAYM